MADPDDGLVRALQRGDAASARRALAMRRARGAESERDDPALDVLATTAAGGSALAAELLIEHLDDVGVIRRFVHGLLLDETAIDDVCQDVLISVAGSIESFAGTSKVTTWVHQIAKRRVVDHLRRQRATVELPADDASPSRRMSTAIATRQTVRDALAGLPDLYRAPVTLRDVEGLSYADVAERLDLPVGTVKAQVSRGRALVAAAIGGLDA